MRNTVRLRASGASRRWSRAATRELERAELALDRALLAVVAAEELDPESYGARWIADLAAKAHAYVANAHRILGEFGAAEAEFSEAEVCLCRGVDSGRAEAAVFALKASLRKDQHKHQEALALLDRVERFHEKRREAHEIGRMALKRAVVFETLGRPLEAADECARAASLLDPARDPSWPLVARKNAIEFLVSAGEIGRTRGLFDQLPSMPEPLDDLRRRWVEANLLRAEERFGEAREVYEEVRARFAEAGVHYNAALAALDLALTAQQEGGRLAEVRHMAEQATIQLTLSGAKSQAFAAQRLLLQAVREDAVTRAVLEKVRTRLEALRPS